MKYLLLLFIGMSAYSVSFETSDSNEAPKLTAWGNETPTCRVVKQERPYGYSVKFFFSDGSSEYDIYYSTDFSVVVNRKNQLIHDGVCKG